jgi:hypothetical protein
MKTMNYTEKLIKEIERVTLRGNADKETIRVLASIIYDMEQRIIALETPVKETKATTTTTTRKTAATKEEK